MSPSYILDIPRIYVTRIRKTVDSRTLGTIIRSQVNFLVYNRISKEVSSLNHIIYPNIFITINLRWSALQATLACNLNVELEQPSSLSSIVLCFVKHLSYSLFCILNVSTKWAYKLEVYPFLQ